MMPGLTTPIQHPTRSPSHCNTSRKRNTVHADYKERSKTIPICKWHDHLNWKSQGIYKKLPELLSKFSKVSWHRAAYKN